MTVVTFLFTDIEGSTRRWEANADAMRSALAAHDAVLRDAVSSHDGHVFKHTGDGVCAVFTSPGHAVDAAVASQRLLELPVRMGLATGEAELRDGDYFGAVLNRASRVMAAGHGGQILLDGPTAALISDIEMTALGPKRLRDIAKPVNIYQVVAAGLHIDFPPLQTTDRVPGNLRPPTTSFVGRDNELAELETALESRRVLTLTGVGGVGKTRLALELATRSADKFTDGVFVIEFAAVIDPAAVPEAVAAVLGVTQQPGLSVAGSVANALEGRSRLLLFDNCEHVLDAAADMVDAILSHSSTVKVLATSREGLRLADEQLWPVPSLANTGVDAAAATLFAERARAVAPTLSLSEPHDARAVVEICDRLDGIPLGIELAASRLQSMTVADVRDRLDDRFRLLIGSRRGLERHQTLRHAVQWSFDLLDDAEKRVLTTCSVFAGGFDLAGVCAVSGSADEFATLDLLDSLTRKSLLVADRTSAHARFSMLETIRQFAEEQLVNVGDADDTRAAHARYFASSEAYVLSLWDGPRQRQAYEWFGLELANLRAAFRWATDNGEIDTAAAIAVFATFVGSWVDQREPATWAEELVVLPSAADHRRRGQLQLMAAECYATGRSEDAVNYLEAGLASIETGCCDDVSYDMDALLGGVYLWVGQPDRWAELCRETIARRPDCRLHVRACLAMALYLSGSFDESIAVSEDLLAAAEATENPGERVWALMAYGQVRWDFGAPKAIAFDAATISDVLSLALKIAQQSGNRQLETHTATTLADVAAASGRPNEAFEFYTLSIRNYYDSGSFSHLHTPLGQLASFFDRLGHFEPAATIMGFADDYYLRMTYPRFETTVAHLREALGDHVYELFAHEGESMSNAEMAAYALDQIEQTRAQLAQRDEPT
ncbi:ATP-binding protein [Mycobacterium sp. NPDC051804]|uniref:ATP-binding protein n=1 Tax=Mycobacterium sp. NPDC051804 TaxID=3364295 RepID=UPI0037BA077D